MPLKILLLSDGRPGHYHLADGVVAAVERITKVELTRLEIARHKLVPARLLRALLKKKLASPAMLLSLGYGISERKLPHADLVVSAGGETLIANIAAAKALGVPNIFCGSLRNVDPKHISVVITSYQRFADRLNHLVTLKPNVMDPDALGRPLQVPVYGAQNPPAIAGLLIGGNAGPTIFRAEDWSALFSFLRKVSEAWGTRWFISTSRRTQDSVGDDVAALAKDHSIVHEFIDYRTAGPGTLKKVFAGSDIILCTEDSSTMVSEAICARLPVVGVSPLQHSFKPEENEYREFLAGNNWCRTLPIAELSVERFARALGEIKPPGENHLDMLAGKLQESLPALFSK